MLKGDVLAYLGVIDSSYSSEQSARISKLGQLDLSNVKAAPSKPAAPPPRQSLIEKDMSSEPETDTEVAVPISLASVLSVQKRLQATLGVTLPLHTFITRATELANDDLPRSSDSIPTADELYDDILGLTKLSPKTAKKGHYMPQITALPSADLTVSRSVTQRQPDIYDVLTGYKSSSNHSEGLGGPTPRASGDPRTNESINVFSVSAPKGDEKIARAFLERMKTILQVEPGRLIL